MQSTWIEPAWRFTFLKDWEFLLNFLGLMLHARLNQFEFIFRILFILKSFDYNSWRMRDIYKLIIPIFPDLVWYGTWIWYKMGLAAIIDMHV